MTNKHNRRRLVHTGCWPAQLALWLVLIGACFAMPNNVFSAVGQAFKVFAGLFLVRFLAPADTCSRSNLHCEVKLGRCSCDPHRGQLPRSAEVVDTLLHYYITLYNIYYIYIILAHGRLIFLHVWHDASEAPCVDSCVMPWHRKSRCSQWWMLSCSPCRTHQSNSLSSSLIRLRNFSNTIQVSSGSRPPLPCHHRSRFISWAFRSSADKLDRRIASLVTRTF